MECNIYCDESNHLKHNKNRFMTLGFISCEKEHVKKVSDTLRAIKERHGLNRNNELKWTKVSISKLEYYKELIIFFKESDYLQFRCIIADKESLDLKRFSLSYDDWYYRMYYLLLGKTLKEENVYNIYIDIKDTCGGKKINELKNVLTRSYYDFYDSMFKNVQLVHSHEVEILQLTDLFIGAIGYKCSGLETSLAKLKVIDLLESTFKRDISNNTPRYYNKFNIFNWEGR